MSHPSAKNLAAFANGELGETEAAEITMHLESCVACDDTLQSFETQQDDIIAQLQSPPIVDPYTTEFLGRHSVDGLESSFKLLLAQKKPSENVVGDKLLDVGSIRDYALLEQIGRGGMGAVYKARHTGLDRIVAIKVLPTDRLEDPAAIARFKREWKAVAKVNHPNIVQAYDAGEQEANYFLVMEFVSGLNLAQLVQRIGPLPIADACELIRQAAIGLQHAHEHSLVHRDVKPANLMLATSQSSLALDDPQQPIVKILDLGLARLFTEQEGDLTSTEQIMGTIDYMAPEQTRDSHQVDIRADVYSLGASLYKLLSGRAPFEGPEHRTFISKLAAITNEPLPSLGERRDDLPNELLLVVQKMVAKEPRDRFATPQEVADALVPFCRHADLVLLGQNICNPDSHASDGEGSSRSTSSWAKNPLNETTRNRPDVDQHLPQISVTVESKSKRRKQARIFSGRTWAIGLASAIAFVVFGAIVFVQTQFGMLQIETVDDSVRVVVSRNASRVKIIDLENGHRVRLWPGEYSLKVEGRDDLVVENGAFVLKRRDEKVAKIVWRPTTSPRLETDAQVGLTLNEEDWKLIGGVNFEKFETWLESLRGSKFRIIHLNGHYHLGRAQFAGIAVRVPYVPYWEVHHNASLSAHRADFDRMPGRGFHPSGSCGFSSGEDYESLLLWEKQESRDFFRLRSYISEEEFRNEFHNSKADLVDPVEVSAYPSGDSFRFSARFEFKQGLSYTQHGLSASELTSLVQTKCFDGGFRPISAFAYPDGSDVRYGIVVRNNGREPDFGIYLCEGLDDFSQRVGRMLEQGMRPDRLVAYSEGDECRYIGIWVEQDDYVTSLPKTGVMPAELAVLDDIVERFMVERGIPAGGMAVIKDGKVIASRGYGFIDRLRKTPTTPETPFRLGPVTQVFTRAAIAKLVAQGKLTLDTKVMPILGVKNEFDARWSEITVAHLLKHQGGWDGSKSFDPIFDAYEIAEKGSLGLPLTNADLIEYMATQPLQVRPGSKAKYYRFGYSILGELVAKVSGKSYVDFVTEELLTPLGLPSIRPGRTLPRSRLANEPYYSYPYFARNVIEPSSSEYVPEPDGAFALEEAAASLGLIGSASDVAKFFLHYDFDGRSGEQMEVHRSWRFIPGSYVVSRVRSDGVIVVALFNQNRDSTGLSYHSLIDTLDHAIDEIEEWPTTVSQ